MMPFQNNNPNYYAWSQQYFPQQNPYMQRIENLQQFQQALQPQTPVQSQFPALGKMVDSIDAVKATDIPMDGNMYYFPTADGSIIFGKRWMSNGTTVIQKYFPESEELTEQKEDSLNLILEKILMLEKITSNMQSDLEVIKNEKTEKKSTKSCS